MAADIKEFPHPPRVTGDVNSDIAAMNEYMWALFRVVFLERGGITQGDDLGGLAGVDAVATDDIQDGAVTPAKIQEIATNSLLGRETAGVGVVELIACTAIARSILASGTAAAIRTVLALGALATANTVTIAQIDALSAAGSQLLTNGRFILPSYTVGTLPVATSAGEMIYVTDESGGAVPAFSDGAAWRRVTDRAVVS